MCQPANTSSLRIPLFRRVQLKKTATRRCQKGKRRRAEKEESRKAVVKHASLFVLFVCMCGCDLIFVRPKWIMAAVNMATITSSHTRRPFPLSCRCCERACVYGNFSERRSQTATAQLQKPPNTGSNNQKHVLSSTRHVSVLHPSAIHRPPID